MSHRKWNCGCKLLARLTVFILAISIIVLYILCLTGSTYTNPHVPQIFLAQIQKSNTSILIGFYGICTGPSSPSPACTTTISRSAATVTAALFPNQAEAAAPNTSSLVAFALELQRKILLSPLPLAAGLFLLSLFFLTLTRLLGKRQRHLVPSRRLRYLKTFALALTWLSTAVALMAAVLAMGVANGVVYVVSEVGDGDVNVTAGGFLQVLLWAVFGAGTVFSVVIISVLGDRRGRKGRKRVDFEAGLKEFEDDHIIVI